MTKKIIQSCFNLWSNGTSFLSIKLSSLLKYDNSTNFPLVFKDDNANFSFAWKIIVQISLKINFIQQYTSSYA